MVYGLVAGFRGFRSVCAHCPIDHGLQGFADLIWYRAGSGFG